MGESLQELRHSLRRLRRTPGFTFAALLTLALGRGARTVSIGCAAAIDPVVALRMSNLVVVDDPAGALQLPPADATSSRR